MSAQFYDQNGELRLDGTLVGGGVTRLGPYAVTYQTPGVTDPIDYGALVGPTLAIGTMLVAGWFVVTSAWTVDAGAVDGLLLSLDPFGLTLAQTAAANPVDVVSNVPGSGDNPFQMYIRAAPQRLAVAAYSDTGSGTFTGGAASMYALIVAP